MGYIYYDPDSNTGYHVSDEDIKIGGKVAADGIFALGSIYLKSLIIALALLMPFFGQFLLDDFVNTFVANNALFFLILGILILLLKFFPRFTSNIIVRLLFDIYVIVAILYVFFYTFHFDVPMCSFITTFFDEDSARVMCGDQTFYAMSNHWFYDFFVSAANYVMNLIISLGQGFSDIDTSVFQSSFSEFDILAFFKAVGQYAWRIIAISLIVILCLVALLIMAVFSVILPYVVAIVCVILINKFFYKMHTRTIRKIQKNSDFEERIRICSSELQRAVAIKNHHPEQSVIIYEKIANEGNPTAQFLYAEELTSGKNILRNKKRAAAWYHKAAEQGLSEAQLMMACIYFSGTGVSENRSLAKAWLEKAMEDKELLKKSQTNSTIKETISIIMKKSQSSSVIEDTISMIMYKTRYADCF